MSGLKKRTSGLVLVVAILITAVALIVFNQNRHEGQQLSPSSEFATIEESNLKSGLTDDEDQKHMKVQSQQANARTVDSKPLGAASGLEPQTFSELLQKYAPEERNRLTQFSDDHFGALEFSTPEQREWMRRHGYPDVEDILEAENLSFEELQQRAAAGDRVAMALASERALNLMMEEGYLWQELGEDPFLSSQDTMEYYLQSRRYASELQRTGSPFGAYLKARWEFESTLLSAAQPMSEADVASAAATAVNSLYMAELMGDARIDRFAQRFAYATGISTDTISIVRSAFLTVRAAQAGTDCITLFGNERMP